MGETIFAESLPLQTVWVSLGSNVDPERNLRLAVREVSARVAVEGLSRVFESPPVGAPGTPVFLNAALRLKTVLAAEQLKHELLRPIETALKRMRTRDRNAPRTIDLDLALYDRLIIVDREAGLEIPDPEILTRAHVALPLADLDPGLAHPATGESLGAIARRLAGTAAIRVREEITLV